MRHKNFWHSHGCIGPCEPHAALQMCIYKHSMLLTCAGKGRQPKHVWHVSSKWLSDTAFAYMVAPLENYIVDSQ